MNKNRAAKAIRDGGAAPMIGTTLRGTYRLVRPLGVGGCGDIYVAAHTRLGSEVAVKVLHPGLASAADALDLFRQEADIMSALRHPHVVQILDFNVTETGVPFLVMELLDGQSLTQRMVAGRPFEPAAALRIIDQIAQALEAAHTHGIVHLDLKPDNVILLSIDGHDDFVKVIDFGISRATWRAGVIDESLVTGTPEYMAPEQARGAGEDIDHRADQFSLAAVAYALLTGHEPFEGPSLAALLDQVIHQTQQPPSQRAPWLGPEVDGVVGRGMSKQAVDRYPGVMVFSEALRAALEGVDVAPYAARFTMPPEAFRRRPRARSLLRPLPGGTPGASSAEPTGRCERAGPGRCWSRSPPWRRSPGSRRPRGTPPAPSGAAPAPRRASWSTPRPPATPPPRRRHLHLHLHLRGRRHQRLPKA